jgi:hypothetical protein
VNNFFIYSVACSLPRNLALPRTFDIILRPFPIPGQHPARFTKPWAGEIEFKDVEMPANGPKP